MTRDRFVAVAAAGFAVLGTAVWTMRSQPPSVRPGASVTQPESNVVEGNALSAATLATDVSAAPATPSAAEGFDPELAAAMDEFTQMDDDLSARLKVPPSWIASSSPPPRPAASLPALPSATTPSAQLAEASRWFDALPRDDSTTRAQLDAKRARMSKVGLDLLQSACRSGVCRLSFSYSAFSSERLTRRMNGQDSARSRPNWWSFTIIKPDGRVEGHVFMTGGASRGGAQ